MKNTTYLSMAMLSISLASSADATQVKCTENSTTYIFGPSDLKVMEGVRVRDGVANKSGNFTMESCIAQNADGVIIPGGGSIDVEVDADVSWEGMIDPLKPEQQNKIMFDLESISQDSYSVSQYRLGNMVQRVGGIAQDGRQYVSATSRKAPFKADSWVVSEEQNNVKVGVCVIRPNVNVTLKEIRIRTDVYVPGVCDNAN